MHFVIKLLVFALPMYITLPASAQKVQPRAAQATIQAPGDKAEAPPAADQAGAADKNDNCQSLMYSAQVKVLSDDQKASLAKCVSEQGFGGNGFTAKFIESPMHDLTHGPGPNNDIVGRHGWVRSRLGF
jgi:hypothetical protein